MLPRLAHRKLFQGNREVLFLRYFQKMIEKAVFSAGPIFEKGGVESLEEFRRSLVEERVLFRTLLDQGPKVDPGALGIDPGKLGRFDNLGRAGLLFLIGGRL